jgi:type I restriction enzyme S subunit
MELKPGYKQTEVGVIPEDWDVKRLRDISPSQSVGIVINPSSYFEANGEVPMLVGSCISENKINAEKASRISSKNSERLSACRLKAGDLVTVRVGFPGTTAVVPTELDGCNCASMMIIRRHKSFDSYWLAQLLNSPIGRVQIENVEYGTAQKQFNISHAIDFIFPVPPPAEQSKIAEAAKNFDEYIESLEQKIEKKRRIKQAAMQELLTGKLRLPGFEGEWEVKRLGDEIRDLEAGVSVRSTTDNEQPSTGHYILKTSAVSQGQFSPIETKEIISCDISRAKTPIKAGDLIISRMNTPALVGECGYSHSDHPNLFLPDRLWRAAYRDPQAVSSRWLSYTLSTQQNRTRIKELATGTSGSMKNISKRPLLDLQIKWPSLDEQNTIAKVLSEMDDDIDAINAQLNKAQGIKRGMMQQLLTGKIRLR